MREPIRALLRVLKSTEKDIIRIVKGQEGKISFSCPFDCQEM